jgi:integrase
VASGYLDDNPARVLKRPKKTWQPDPFSEEELIFLLEEAKKGVNGVRNYAIVCTLLDSGIRNSELRNLRVEDVSLKTGQIFIREGKGSKSRTVVVGKRTKDALWRWLVVRPDDSRWLFCATKTGPRIGA